MIWPFNRKPKVETRASGTGYTAEVLSARESWIAGSRGIAELTGTVQACVSLWEGGLGLADVDGTDLLDRRSLSLMARSLALRGEAVFLIGDTRLIACADWDLSTRDGEPRAYRLSVSEVGGGRSTTALAAEVLHFRIGSDVAAPWTGTAPLRRAHLSAGMLNAVEESLREVFEYGPIGSMIAAMPEMPDTSREALQRGFRAKRGRVLLTESVNVAAAGGPTPVQDWTPKSTTPDLQRAMTGETLKAARDSVSMAFGVQPSLFAPAVTGPATREAQRHLAQWTLQPVAALIAEEAAAKLGQRVALDVMRPMQAFDAGGRARAASAMVKALAEAKAAGVDPAPVLKLVDWER